MVLPRNNLSKSASKTRANCVSPTSGLRLWVLVPAGGPRALHFTFGQRANTNILGNVRKLELSSLVQSVKTFLLRANTF